MITKEMFCKKIISDFTRKNDMPNKGELDAAVMSSSRLAVALEFLGLIKDPEMKAYAATRGGIEQISYDSNKEEVFILSTREMIDLLPDKV